MAELLKDPRFAGIPKNPKFRGMPKNERKIKIDKRFSSMLKNEEFRVVYTVDKRGRPVNQSSSENLRKYYDLSSEDDTAAADDDNDNNDGDNEIDDQVESDNSTKNRKLSKKKESVKADKKIKNLEKKKVNKNEKIKKKTCVKKDETDSSKMKIDDIEKVNYETNSSAETDDDENYSDVDKPEVIKNKIDKIKNKENKKKNNTNIKLKSKVSEKLKDLSVDYARGKGVLLSSSSSEEESSEEEEENIEHNWGELDKNVEQVDEPTERLALCNMDWDKIRAVDLMVLFTSFLPPGGLVRSVTIYPTEFGIERMKEEDIKGPIEITEAKKTQDNNNLNNETDENDQESDNQMEKIRQYQLNRLKYYVAVIVLDSKSSAEKIYTALDGIEYESTATKIDLRVITDDKVFNQKPKEVCDKYPDVSKYKPRNFITTALQQVNVKSTWDENNMGRQEFIKKINSGQLDDISSDVISTYVKLSSSDDDSDNENLDNSNDGIKFKNDKKQSRIDRFRSLLKEMEENDNKKKEDDIEIECTWGLNLKEKSEKLVEKKMNNKDELAPFDKYLLKRKEKKKSKIEEKKKKLGNVSDSEDSIPSDIDINDPYFKNEIMKIKSNKTKNKKSKKNSTLCNDDTDDDENKQDNAELELLLLDREDEKLKNHFDMNKIEENEASSKSKKKRLRKKKTEEDKNNCQDNFTVNVDDPRFVAIYSSHEYNIDPTDPHYRKTKGTEALVKEKLKRRVKNDNPIEVTFFCLLSSS